MNGDWSSAEARAELCLITGHWYSRRAPNCHLVMGCCPGVKRGGALSGVNLYVAPLAVKMQMESSKSHLRHCRSASIATISVEGGKAYPSPTKHSRRIRVKTTDSKTVMSLTSCGMHAPVPGKVLWILMKDPMTF